MRQLKITEHIKISEKERDSIIKRFERKTEIQALLEAALLDEIRKGNRNVIPKLVDSCENLIIQIIENERQRQINNKPFSMEKTYNAGRLVLTKLAEKELGSTGREVFFRFGAWCVRQAIINELTGL